MRRMKFADDRVFEVGYRVSTWGLLSDWEGTVVGFVRPRRHSTNPVLVSVKKDGDGSIHHRSAGNWDIISPVKELAHKDVR